MLITTNIGKTTSEHGLINQGARREEELHVKKGLLQLPQDQFLETYAQLWDVQPSDTTPKFEWDVVLH